MEFENNKDVIRVFHLSHSTIFFLNVRNASFCQISSAKIDQYLKMYELIVFNVSCGLMVFFSELDNWLKSTFLKLDGIRNHHFLLCFYSSYCQLLRNFLSLICIKKLAKYKFWRLGFINRVILESCDISLGAFSA